MKIFPVDCKGAARGFVSICVVVLLPLTAGCSGKELFYQGMYDGLSAADQQQRTKDPSYHPVQEQKQPSYEEYKKEREEILDRDGSVNAAPVIR